MPLFCKEEWGKLTQKKLANPEQRQGSLQAVEAQLDLRSDSYPEASTSRAQTSNSVEPFRDPMGPRSFPSENLDTGGSCLRPYYIHLLGLKSNRGTGAREGWPCECS